MSRSAHANGLLATVAALLLSGHADAAPFKVLHKFQDSPDGRWPVAGVIADGAGNLYGTTAFGGASGTGSVYKIAPDGTESVFYSFGDWTVTGSFPRADLIMDGDGNLYGTTQFGGSSTGCNDQGCGTVFKIAPDGTETVLHAFHDDGTDGIMPSTALVRDDTGNLYGGASQGGAGHRGVIFKIAPGGAETQIHTFTGEENGDTGNPTSLMADKHGNLYGTTAQWTHIPCGQICGAVFKIAPDGTESILHAFTGNADGASPYGGMVFDRHGNLYGTAEVGAAGYGTVFKIAHDGSFGTLYAFAGGSDGDGPQGDLAIDKNGNLYGTTWHGGGACFHGAGCGTIFKVAPDGTETVMHAFTRTQGYYPASGLIKDKTGTFYGTAQYVFNSTAYGSLFKFKP